MSTNEVINSMEKDVKGQNGTTARWVSTIVAVALGLMSLTLPVIGKLILDRMQDQKEQQQELKQAQQVFYNKVEAELQANASERKSMLAQISELDRRMSVRDASQYTSQDAAVERVRIDDRISSIERSIAVLNDRLIRLSEDTRAIKKAVNAE